MSERRRGDAAVNESLVEKRIREASEAGAFDNLPGAGKPLPPDDAQMVPDELRVAYRLLKNAGFAPPEIGHRRSIAALESMLYDDASLDAAVRARALKRLSLLRAQVDGAGIGSADRAYQRQLLERMGRR